MCAVKGDMDRTVGALENQFELRLSSSVREGIALYLGLLEKWERRINLTTVRSPAELLEFHFFEAFAAAKEFLPFGSAVADIGSGAGFPGMAMKLYRPDISVTLIETNEKKTVFLETVARALGLEVTVFHGRAEDYDFWDRIAVASIRALKPSPALLSLLQENRVGLLYFRGKNEHSMAKAGWQLRKEVRHPSAENRFISLYTPA